MYDTATSLITDASHIVVVQAENPDGDSLGSALALEEIIGDLGKQVTLHCPVDIPRYLRYFPGWDRVTSDMPHTADLMIIVDTSAQVLLSKTLENPTAAKHVQTKPVLVIDHHATGSTLEFTHTMLSEQVVATSHVILNLANHAGWSINKQASEHMLAALLSDSLGLSTQNVTSSSYQAAAQLTDLGAASAAIEDRRREFMKKSPEILSYKARLIERVEYFLDGKLAVVHVPFEEIQAFSDQYNPGALIGDELRLVEGVEVNCVIKTYPDGKLTARLRSQTPVSEAIAAYFGGGGHRYAAGFRIHEAYGTTLKELVAAADKVMAAQDSAV